MMKQAAFQCIVIVMLWSSAVWGYAEGVTPTKGALFETTPGGGWTSGFSAALSRREFEASSEVLDVDIFRAVARVGMCPVGPLYGFLEAGWGKAELPPDRESDGGFAWAVGANLALWDHVLRRSPVLGKTRVFGVAMRLRHEGMESEVEAQDFSWQETRLSPIVRYTVNRAADGAWLPYTPAMVSVYGGICYSELKGDFDHASVSGHHDFGFVTGVDSKHVDGWIIGVSGTFFNQRDRIVGVDLRYHF